ncbi:MAG: YhcN/YlaJ family sporulation lipoprotein [Kyrpidia tusciae]|nr:YhcN/YlaJ family sporulation lipoprotein [Kyrpidia tusciae]MBE3552389.1 YhcN/YlaJ family sporulation lipoprotein [Kyrpidia tusciae]
MSQRRRNWLSGAAAAVGAVLVITGCGIGQPGIGAQPPAAPKMDRSRIDVDGDGDRNRWAHGQDVLNPPVSLGTLPSPRSGAGVDGGEAALADRVADVASSVPGVQSAAAVVRNHRAFIGIRVSMPIRDAERTEQVKTEIRQRLLITAPVINEAHITEDRALLRQIEDVADAVRAGRPVSDFQSRIAQWQRQIPRVLPKLEPPAPSPARNSVNTPPTPAPPFRGP